MIVPILICKIYVTTKLLKGSYLFFLTCCQVKKKNWQLLITFYYRVYKIVYN